MTKYAYDSKVKNNDSSLDNSNVSGNERLMLKIV
jgi:hypothetical protein